MRTAPERRFGVTRREAAALVIAVPLIAAAAREEKPDPEALRSAALFAMDFG